MSINTQDFITYNNEGFFTCKVCDETKEQQEFRKLKGGKVSTVCRSCTNVKYIPCPKQAHLNAIRCRAKNNGVPFDLTLEDLDIPTECPVLGIPLNDKWGSPNGAQASTNTPSVDRLIPEMGYVKGNTRVISNRANRIKTDATVEEIGLLYKWLSTALVGSLVATPSEKPQDDSPCKVTIAHRGCMNTCKVARKVRVKCSSCVYRKKWYARSLHR